MIKKKYHQAKTDNKYSVTFPCGTIEFLGAENEKADNKFNIHLN